MKFIDKVKIFIKQFNSPLIYILFGASFISLYLKEYVDGLIIIGVIFLNSIVSFIQEVKADEALDALKKLSSPHCLIKENGHIKKILSQDIKVGDILVLEEESVVVGDALIISSNGLKIDESSLTGESIRVEKGINNEIFESTVVVSGRGEAKVIKVGAETEFGKISSFIKEKNEITPLQAKLNNLSKILGLSTIIICIIIFIISLIRKDDLLETLITSISLAVAVIPEGLMAVVTITLSIGVQKLVKVNTIVKNLSSVETLGSISLVCSDKTGTITENNMVVESVYSYNDELLFLAMALCNNATFDRGDPTEIALLKYVKNKININDINKKYPRIKEIPFSSETKMMKTFHNDIIFCKGAIEVILNQARYFYENGEVKVLTSDERKKINLKVDSYYLKSYRVLAFSCYKDNKEIFLGFVGEKDPIREGVVESINVLKEAGIKTIMITGDHLKTAYAIGEELKIINSKNEICLGNQIDSLSDDEFKNINVFARVSPLEKMKIVSRYKSLNEVVAMTGDGVNDAPSLKEADVGISMGKNGTEVARSVSDIILIDDNFLTIQKAIETGRVIYDNIKKSIIFLLSSNLAEVLIMVLCLLLKFPLPLIAIHILWVNLISDSLPALALGSDKPMSNVMKEKPRKKENSMFSNGGLKITLIYGFIICIITFIGFIILPISELCKNGINISTLYNDIIVVFSNEDILIKSRTIAFSVLSISELFHMIGMADINDSIFNILKKKNYFMFIVFLIGFILQFIVTEIPFLVSFFKTSYLTFYEWLWVILLSSIPLVVHEILKK